MKALYPLITLSFIFSGCFNSSERHFSSGCEKIYDYFNKVRKEQNLAPIPDDQSCKKRISAKVQDGGGYFKRLESFNSKVQERAGCGFGISSYVSIYHKDFSVSAPPPLGAGDILAIYGGSDEDQARVSEKYCRVVGL